MLKIRAGWGHDGHAKPLISKGASKVDALGSRVIANQWERRAKEKDQSI